MYSQKLKIETVMESVERLASSCRARGEKCQIKQFAPMEEVVSKRTGRMQRRKVPVFGYYIFIKSRLPEVDMIERSLPDVAFMRQVGNRRLMATLFTCNLSRDLTPCLSLYTFIPYHFIPFSALSQSWIC